MNFPPRLFPTSSLALLLTASLAIIPATAQDSPVPQAPSVLNPLSPVKTKFQYRIDVVDPTAANNPAAAQVQGFRASDQLVVYTSASGVSTGTNLAGVEATVVNGIIQGLSDGNSPIPSDGFVISGHGKGAQWMRNLVKPGAKAYLDPETRQLHVEMTPQVYLNALARLTERIQKTAAEAEPSPAESPDFRQAMDALTACGSQLRALAVSPTGEVSMELLDTAKQCDTLGAQAFYRAVSVKPDEFRGIWVRPAEKTPEAVQQVVDRLKALGIKDVFLETYYQGRTVYPSQVMVEYGLPEQHAQFRGGDPLKLWTEVAHANGLRVHVWAQTFFAGNKQQSFETFGPILNKYPQWRNLQYRALENANPVPSDLEDGHYFVDPANPEVRTFLNKLLMEMISRYEVDGLNLDYIRYPLNASTKSPRYRESSWGATEVARKAFMDMLEAERQAQYTKDHAANPKLPPLKPMDPAKTDPKFLKPTDPLWPRWVQWRKDRISTFVQEVSKQAHAQRPGLMLSAVVFPSHNSEDSLKLQEWPHWVQQGWLDALTPIGLLPTPQGMYRDSVEFREKTKDKVPVYVGVFGMYNRYDPIDFIAQMEAVHRAGMPGIVLFEASRLNATYEEALKKGPFR